eukprot:6253290-Lingulodinium_polyedra.AAC.1
MPLKDPQHCNAQQIDLALGEAHELLRLSPCRERVAMVTAGNKQPVLCPVASGNCHAAGRHARARTPLALRLLAVLELQA